jgi:hypothetical protein
MVGRNQISEAVLPYAYALTYHIRGAALNALADLELGGPSHRDTPENISLELCTKLRMRDFQTVQNRLFIYGGEPRACIRLVLLLTSTTTFTPLQ